MSITTTKPRVSPILEAVLSSGNGFDPDVWHVMDRRDNALISDELQHGAQSSKFVYQFPIKGSADPVSGISVIGARQLAHVYGGIKHRMVASVQKIGSLFTFTSYPSETSPMNVTAQRIEELADEPDFFQSLVEVSDVKKGNTIQVERRELRFEFDRAGNAYERQHYATIAQSKAFRNGVLSLIPQDAQLRWKVEMLKLGKMDIITEDVLSDKRSAVLRFAASKAIGMDRAAIEAITFDQISGLSDAAREGSLPAFTAAAEQLGLLRRESAETKPRAAAAPAPTAATAPKASTKPARAATAAPAPEADPKPAVRQETAPGPDPHKGESPPPDAETQQATTDPFEVYLVTAYGELVEGDSRFFDPVQFAHALEDMWLHAQPDQVAAIKEHNADAIEEARRASAEADDIILKVWNRVRPEKVKAAAPAAPETLAAAAAGPAGALQVPLNARGQIDLALYVDQALAIHDAMTMVEELDAWDRINLPTFGKFPASKKLEISKSMVATRARLMAPAAEPKDGDAPEDEDIFRARLFLGDLAAARPEEVLTLQRNPVFARTYEAMKTKAPDLWQKITAAIEARTQR